jgi:hypothetical protein
VNEVRSLTAGKAKIFQESDTRTLLATCIQYWSAYFKPDHNFFETRRKKGFIRKLPVVVILMMMTVTVLQRRRTLKRKGKYKKVKDKMKKGSKRKIEE